jgi:K+-transporting ATPase A subunit
MSKNKKKRNKVYTGAGAAIERPVVVHIKAANRNKVGQWWFDHKKQLKPILITIGVVVFIVLIILEIIHINS